MSPYFFETKCFLAFYILHFCGIYAIIQQIYFVTEEKGYGNIR